MIIGHFSDLHGQLSPLWTSSQVPDVWLNTGDFFPDDPVLGYGGLQETVYQYQKQWFLPVRKRFLERLGGAPLVTCPGNHDVHNLHRLLQHLYPVTEVTPEGVVVRGVRWAGFGYTPLQLPQELLGRLAATSLGAQPDVLVTHAPPAGVLCGRDPTWGLSLLPGLLRTTTPHPRVHCFGHVHEDGGKTQRDAWGTHYYNGARHLRFIDTEEFGL